MRQSRENELLKQDRINQKTWSMKVKVLIHNLTEQNGENCEKKNDTVPTEENAVHWAL